MFTNWAVFLKDKKPLQSRTLSGYCVDWFSDQNDYIKLSLTMVIDNICAVQRVYVWNNCLILSGYWFRFCSHKPLIVKLWSKINFPVLLIYCFNVLICFHFRRGWMDYFLMHFSVCIQYLLCYYQLHQLNMDCHSLNLSKLISVQNKHQIPWTIFLQSNFFHMVLDNSILRRVSITGIVLQWDLKGHHGKTWSLHTDWVLSLFCLCSL